MTGLRELKLYFPIYDSYRYTDMMVALKSIVQLKVASVEIWVDDQMYDAKMKDDQFRNVLEGSTVRFHKYANTCTIGIHDGL